MARERHVFPTDEIPHLWAHQTQSEAHNPQHNLFFEGATIYSYRHGAPLATIHTRGKNKLVLYNAARWSVTTGKHQSDVRRALTGYLPYVEVPHLFGYGTDTEPSHNDNFRYLMTQSKEALERSKRARSNGSYELDKAFKYRDNARDYAKFFKVKMPKFSFLPTGKQLKAISAKIADREARAATREIAKQNRREAKRAEQNRIAALELPEKIEAWRNGAYVGFGYYGSELPTMLRIVGNEVETSRGARFPVTHACKGLTLVEACVSSNREWIRNGHTLHLGHYQIDRIEANGTVHAGCHIVPYLEISLIAPKLREMCKELRESMPRTASDEIL